jgi:hypothetical protein
MLRSVVRFHVVGINHLTELPPGVTIVATTLGMRAAHLGRPAGLAASGRGGRAGEAGALDHVEPALLIT